MKRIHQIDLLRNAVQAEIKLMTSTEEEVPKMQQECDTAWQTFHDYMIKTRVKDDVKETK